MRHFTPAHRIRTMRMNTMTTSMVIWMTTLTNETLYSSSSDQDNAYEYDDDIYGYLDDYAY